MTDYLNGARERNQRFVIAISQLEEACAGGVWGVRVQSVSLPMAAAVRPAQ